jgi:hypothetical protein
MLTTGDLVRIMQDSFLYPADSQPWLAKRIKHPEYGVVVETLGDETTVFIDNNKWIVNNKQIQLIGDDNVYKSTKSIGKDHG